VGLLVRARRSYGGGALQRGLCIFVVSRTFVQRMMLTYSERVGYSSCRSDDTVVRAGVVTVRF